MMEGVVATCDVSHPGGTRIEQSVPIIDCGAGGLQVVWPGFLHTGTEASVSIKRPGQPNVTIQSRCVWCRFLTGRYHAIGLQANAPISIRELVSQNEWLAACAANPDIDLPIVGRLTFLCENDLNARAVHFQTRTTELEMTRVETRGALIDTIERGGADALLIDIDAESVDAASLLSECRERSFTGPILFMSMDRESEFLAGVDALSRTRCILMPMRQEAITGALRDVLREHPECVIETSPIYSDSPGSPDREEFLQGFIDEAIELVEQGAAYFKAGKFDETVKAVRSLASSGGSHGYSSLSDAAERYLSACENEDTQKRLPSLLHTLHSVVHRLDPGDSPGK